MLSLISRLSILSMLSLIPLKSRFSRNLRDQVMTSRSSTISTRLPGKFNTTTISAKAESTGTTHTANAPLRRWCMGLRASIFMEVMEFLTWFRQIGDLERQRRKKAVSRALHWRRIGGMERRRGKKAVNGRLRRRRVWHTRYPSFLDLKVEVCFQLF
ncbi:LOW QUALITY PROTEIN: hypothetical protein Cgig2_020713 [Carnegiea gigantea]|uniref:Uncharacterized protein n=1 Tax=Carnegiea gigantea TaxID=171969 RepID=A0A9Q1JIT9_9CARY|nr:LOW QUALITY PROTEIN: hypothetical protein Cgig2_020713 [Carnegiea gigantea]